MGLRASGRILGRLFERQWLVNAILWGNFARLRDAALAEYGKSADGEVVLQVACVYGDLTTRLTDRLDAGATLDVVDAGPVQLHNLRRKLGSRHVVDALARSMPDCRVRVDPAARPRSAAS